MTFTPVEGQLIDPATLGLPGYTNTQNTIAVAVASAAVFGITGRQFGLVTADKWTGSASAVGFQLPAYPVANLTLEVSTDTGWQTVDPTTYFVHEDTGWVDTAFPPINQPSGNLGTVTAAPLLPNYAWPLRVTYDHGYTVIPVDIQTVCTHLACEYLRHPSPLVEQKIGEIAYRWAPNLVGHVEPWAQAILSRFRDVGVS